MSTQEKIEKAAAQLRWTVNELPMGTVYQKGALRIVVAYGQSGQILSASFGNGREIAGKGKYERVVVLMARWQE